MLSPWGEWIPYYEADIEHKHFKVDDPMPQEAIKEAVNMFNKILSQSPPNSALNIQPPMSLPIPSPIEPHQFTNDIMIECEYFSKFLDDFSVDEDDDKFPKIANSTSIIEKIRASSLSQSVSPSSSLFLVFIPLSPEPNGGTMTINKFEDLYGNNSCYISIDKCLNYFEDSNDLEIREMLLEKDI
ncbi:hypothetical protein GIB67_022081 [Kingdonia uniflora]|uniref:Uncharacterized protein n=1 Tax=Kingdonia uniflora TaxID=39325 RepID=A0A7J7MUH4_9MAGN|nr:hypothetical protein GIB67_022081 [Kingdonia uniflora]